MADEGERPLTGEQETLFITLYSRALESRRENPIIVDPKAEEILREVGYNFDALGVPLWTHIALAIRARRIDEVVEGFIARHPDAIVVHLACGLDSRAERLHRTARAWYDVDLPDVIALRRRFYKEREGYTMIPCSVLDFEWSAQVVEQGPTIIVAEGLTMYLAESDVRRLVLHLHERFPGAELLFDAFSTLTVRRVGAHPAIERTGATIRWGTDDASEVERWAPGIKLLGEWSFTRSPYLNNLRPRHRLLFWLAGLFRAGRIAHRILHYRL